MWCRLDGITVSAAIPRIWASDQPVKSWSFVQQLLQLVGIWRFGPVLLLHWAAGDHDRPFTPRCGAKSGSAGCSRAGTPLLVRTWPPCGCRTDTFLAWILRSMSLAVFSIRCIGSAMPSPPPAGLCIRYQPTRIYLMTTRSRLRL
jgi:hypothetical protein